MSAPASLSRTNASTVPPAGTGQATLASNLPQPAAPQAPARAPTGAQVLALARRYLDLYGRVAPLQDEPLNGGPVQQALERLAKVYNASTDEGFRAQVAADADRLLDGARSVGWLKGHSGFEDYAQTRKAPAAQGRQPEQSASVPSSEIQEPPQPPARFRLTDPISTRVGPSGSGTNVAVTGSGFIGARLRRGDGAPPKDWNALPNKPYMEFGAGVSIKAGAPADARDPAFLSNLGPGLQVYADRGTANTRIRIAATIPMVENAWGDRPPSAELTVVQRIETATARLDLQTAAPLTPDAPRRFAGRGELVVPVTSQKLPLRARVTASSGTTGVHGETTWGAALGLASPAPGYPATPRPVLDLATTRQTTPTATTTTHSVTAGYADPKTVATLTVSQTTASPAGTDPTRTTAASWHVQRSLAGKGTPPTSTDRRTIDAQHGIAQVPPGSGTQITAYTDGSKRLSTNAPDPLPTSALGPDRVRVGVVLQNDPTEKRLLDRAHAEVYYDATPYAQGQAPAHGRLGGEMGVRVRPMPDSPVLLSVAAGAGSPGPHDLTGGSRLRVAGVVPLGPDLTAEAGLTFSEEGDWKAAPYAKVTVRF